MSERPENRSEFVQFRSFRHKIDDQIPHFGRLARYRFSLRSSVDLSIPRIWAAWDLFQPVRSSVARICSCSRLSSVRSRYPDGPEACPESTCVAISSAEYWISWGPTNSPEQRITARSTVF